MHEDVESFRVFAVARLPALYRAAVLLCGSSHSAEDIVQETLTRVYLVWGTRKIDDPAAYAFTTLTRVFLSARRRRSSQEYPTETIPEGRHVDVDVAQRLDLQRALARLSALDRAIVVMRYLEDRSVEDVAAAVGKSPGNVRVRASRALNKLRQQLESAPNLVEPRESCRD